MVVVSGAWPPDAPLVGRGRVTTEGVRARLGLSVQSAEAPRRPVSCLRPGGRERVEVLLLPL